MRITGLVINGRSYERRKGRSVNRWTYMPANGHPRVWVHRTSRLHHALERLATVEEQIIAMQDRAVSKTMEMIAVPDVWSDEEVDGMALAFIEANAKHGFREALMAAAAWLLRYRVRTALESEGIEVPADYRVARAREADHP